MARPDEGTPGPGETPAGAVRPADLAGDALVTRVADALEPREPLESLESLDAFEPREANGFVGRGSGWRLRPGRRELRYRTVLRFGVLPFLVALDVASWVFAVAVTGAGVAAVPAALLALLGYRSGGFYRSRLTLSVASDAPGLLARSLLAAAVAGTLTPILRHGPGGFGSAGSLRRDLLTAVLAVLAVLAVRALGYAVVRLARVGGLVGHNTLVLGAGRVGADVVRQMQQHREFGLRPVGFLDSDPLLTPAERPVPVLGGAEALGSAIVEFGVRNVVVAFGMLPESALVDVIRTCDRFDVEVFFVPRLFELAVGHRDVDMLWGVPLVRLPRPAYLRASWRLKRVFDVVVAGTALLGLAPVLLAVAVVTRLVGGPGVLFRQERIGLDGRPFLLTKFRSLTPVDDMEGATTWNVARDRRLGRWGRFLRRTSLDELPQLWSVVRGEMSLVGPRPERPFFADQFARLYPRYRARHRVPAGVTGWSQVHGLRGDTSIEERARFDNFYIENWTIGLDLRICLLTALAVLRRAGG